MYARCQKVVWIYESHALHVVDKNGLSCIFLHFDRSIYVFISHEEPPVMLYNARDLFYIDLPGILCINRESKH